MTPEPEEDFGAECKRKFRELIEARDLAPFHKDKRVYQAEAESQLDAFNDWKLIQSL